MTLDHHLAQIVQDLGIKSSCDKIIFLDESIEVAVNHILHKRKSECEIIADEEFWVKYLTALRKNHLLHLQKFEKAYGEGNVLIIREGEKYPITKILSFVSNGRSKQFK